MEQNIEYKHYIIGYFTEEFINNVLIIKRECDIKIPKFLEIEITSDVSITDFKTIYNNVCFELINRDEEIILSIPFRFMIHLNDVELCDGKIYITIPFQLFCNEIKISRYQNAVMRLINVITPFASCKLISSGLYYDEIRHNNLVDGYHTEIIQQLCSTELTSKHPINEFTYNVLFKGILKGFYIECENVNDIYEITFVSNNDIVYKYERFLIKKLCVTINKQLLYFPMNCNETHDDRSIKGLEAVHNNLLTNDSLNIKFVNLNSTICVYSLLVNILETSMYHFNVNYKHIIQHVYKFTDNENMNELITDNNKELCCITHEKIDMNSLYMKCYKCKNNFSEENIKKWLKKLKKCPMCRNIWYDYMVYKNCK